MAFRFAFVALFFSIVILSASQGISAFPTVEGKVLCSDCNNHFDFSGIKIMISCNRMEKPLTTTTNKNGRFTAKLPSMIPPINCVAKLLGGPTQLYASKKNIESKIVKNTHSVSNSYVLSSPLIFSISCPASLRSQGKCGVGNSVRSSNTVDLPVPPEWGLAPTSYYFPYVPIIGIP